MAQRARPQCHVAEHIEGRDCRHALWHGHNCQMVSRWALTAGMVPVQVQREAGLEPLPEEDELDGRSNHLSHVSHTSSRDLDVHTAVLTMPPLPPSPPTASPPTALSPCGSLDAASPPVSSRVTADAPDKWVAPEAAPLLSSTAPRSTDGDQQAEATIGPQVATAAALARANGDAVTLPPTIENISQHTRAMEAGAGVQRGRFTFKRTGGADGAPDAAATPAIASASSSMVERLPRGTDETAALTRSLTGPSVAHDDAGGDMTGPLAPVPTMLDSQSLGLQASVPDDGALPPTATPAAGKPLANSKSKRGRFNVTKSINGDRGDAMSEPADLDAARATYAAVVADACPSPPTMLLHREVSETHTHGADSPAVPPPALDAMPPPAVAEMVPTPVGTPAIGASSTGMNGKKASRFNVVEEKGDWPRRGAGESAAPTPSSSHGGGAAARPAAPPPDMMAVVNKKLKELVDASNAQQEAMRMLMSAIGESSRGKDKILTDLGKNPLIAVHLMGSEASSNALVEENARLAAEVEEYKRKHKAAAEKVRLVACLPSPNSHPASHWPLRWRGYLYALGHAAQRPVCDRACRQKRCSERRSCTRLTWPRCAPTWRPRAQRCQLRAAPTVPSLRRAPQPAACRPPPRPCLPPATRRATRCRARPAASRSRRTRTPRRRRPPRRGQSGLTCA